MPSSAAMPRTISVIEQPLQQIMNTPTILTEPASQIAKPKKKSTYSDAVGKKTTAGSSEAKPGHLGGGGCIGASAPAISAPPAHISPPQPPLNLAPGAWPLANEAEKVFTTHLHASFASALNRLQKHTKALPWTHFGILCLSKQASTLAH